MARNNVLELLWEIGNIDKRYNITHSTFGEKVSFLEMLMWNGYVKTLSEESNPKYIEDMKRLQKDCALIGLDSVFEEYEEYIHFDSNKKRKHYKVTIKLPEPKTRKILYGKT